ncbi:hypothetical protein JYU34_019838 [Plutella xylostella]|uniref:Uncharacterized protein n=1 Tax=Plutella xylostella TaxID=51655 RepID=A0ABQ7PVI8_PLUXY|nr:hypothetical protein JYU34_019838 [Plutella xylostella]
MFCNFQTTLLIALVIATNSNPAPLHASNNLRHILIVIGNPRHSFLGTPSRRQAVNGNGNSIPPQSNHAAMAEAELSKSQNGDLEIQKKPYIEKSDNPDSPAFLVLGASSKEDYMKVIPNDIYFNKEQKSVNWLDQSSMNKIQNNWLHKMKGLWR